MRIRQIIVGAIAALTPIVFLAGLPAEAGTSGRMSAKKCFNLPYFGPRGHADFDFGSGIVKLLNEKGIRVEGSAPVKAKRGNAGIYMPIGWKHDHIDPCKGIYYPGGFKLKAENPDREIRLETLWLRADGVYSDVYLDDAPQGEKLIATYKLHEFLPGVLTPRPTEGGIGPKRWPFYVSPYLSGALKQHLGLDVTAGNYLGNLDAVVKFLL